jgi:hypothetical protein
MTFRRNFALLFLLALRTASQDAPNLRGRAVDLAGKPVSKVHVRLSAALSDASSCGTMSTDDGGFSIDPQLLELNHSIDASFGSRCASSSAVSKSTTCRCLISENWTSWCDNSMLIPTERPAIDNSEGKSLAREI